MRYTHYFNDAIDIESVQNLINELHDKEEVDLFFATPGGEICTMNILIHFLNQHPDIKIFLTEDICSAGTLLLVDCIQPMYLHKGLDFILFHEIDRPTNNFRENVINYKTIIKQDLADNNELAKKFTLLGLNTKEIKDFLKGKDVVLYREDFHRLKLNKNEDNR